jgi:hypothetical protein
MAGEKRASKLGLPDSGIHQSSIVNHLPGAGRNARMETVAFRATAQKKRPPAKVADDR